jgi:hypothetical protein
MDTGELFVVYREVNEEKCTVAAKGGGGGAQRPVLRVTEPKKTNGRSSRARTLGKNPLVK